MRVGLAGCGRIAELVHLDALERLPSVELVAVADPDGSRRAVALERVPGARAHPDLDSLLADEAVEAVVVCTPTGEHAETAVAALEAGRHVLIEKPLAASVADGERVAAVAAERPELVAAVAFNLRLSPRLVRLRRAIAAGEAGEVVAVRGVMGSARRELPEWKRARESGGGALLDLCSHHVDLVRFLLDREVVEATALLGSIATEEDTAVLAVRCEGGALATVSASNAGVDEDRIEIVGDRGRLAVDRLDPAGIEWLPARKEWGPRGKLARARRVLARSARALIADARTVGEPSHAACIADFAAAIRGGGPPAASLADGLASLRVLAAAEAAAAEAAVVAG